MASVLRGIYHLYKKTFSKAVRKVFFSDLIASTHNFRNVCWMGQPIWQNVLDLWTIQEAIVEIKPELLIECGTNQGGGALFYANLFDLIGRGRVLTIDIKKMHNLCHPRITFFIGSSLSPEVVGQIRFETALISGPIMVILDDDHCSAHVSKELELYCKFVTPGSFLLVQDGVIDMLPMFRGSRPGPLPAIRDFLSRHSDFEVDVARTERFLITHHPVGWLRRRVSV